MAGTTLHVCHAPLNPKSLSEARAGIVAVLKLQVAAANARGPGIVEILGPLNRRLNRIFTLGSRYSHTRTQYMEALNCLDAFMKDFGFNPTARSGFMELTYALESLDRGVVEKALEPVKYASRPEATLDIWARRGRETVAVGCYVVLQSMSERDASELLGGPRRRDAIRTMYQDFKHGRIKNRRAANFFENREKLIRIARDDCARQGVASNR